MLADELKDNLKHIMEAGGSKTSDQISTLKTMFVIFATTSKDRNLPILQDVVVEFIREEYPHITNELDKLLLLS